MQDKVYLVNYYMDYGTHGLYAIFKNKEDAEACAKIMTEDTDNIGLRYNIYESRVYDSFDKYMSRWEVAE